MRRRPRGPLAIVLVAAAAAILAIGLPAPAATRAASLLPIAIGEMLPEGASSVDHIVILYDGALDPTSVPAPTDFSVTIYDGSATGATRAPTSVSIAYVTHEFMPTAGIDPGLHFSAVRLGLSPSLSVDQAASVTYVPGAHPLRVGDVPADGFASQSIGFAPWGFTYIAALTDEGQGPDHVIAGFSQPLTTGTLPGPGDFSLAVTSAGGSPVPVHVVEVSVATAMQGYGVGFLDLRLDVPLAFDDTVTLTYVPMSTPGTVELRDLAGTSLGAEVRDAPVLMGLAPASTRTTATGPGVVVAPADPATGTQPVTLTFANVGTAGTTTVASTTTAPAIPSGYQLSGTFYEVHTTAIYSGSISLCFSYAGMDPAPTDLLHYESGAWVPLLPVTIDAVKQEICGSTTSLSPFAPVANAITEPSQMAPEVKALRLPAKVERGLLATLGLAQTLYDRHLDRLGNAAMSVFIAEVRALSSSKITPDVAGRLIADATKVKKAHGG